MAFFTNISILLLLACVSHQLMLGSCQRANGRRGRRLARGQQQPVNGKLVTKDKTVCTWAATGEDVFILRVTCRNGGRSYSCDYVAKPAVCPQYASNAKLYWKQIARALKKQKNVCQEGSELLRAGLCRGAARDAHFRLRDAQGNKRQPHTPAPRAAKSCQDSNKRLAGEYCSASWSSFCTFFFTMVQDHDC